MLNIITNNVPRDIVFGHELPESVRADFDYLDWSLDGDGYSRGFIKYRGAWYDIGDFMSTSREPWNHGLPVEFNDWDGYASDSFFSGVLIRFPRDGDYLDTDHVVMATYIG